MAEHDQAAEWLEVTADPPAPSFQGLAPGSQAEWLAIVTNTAARPASLSVEVSGDAGRLTAAGGLRVELTACSGGWVWLGDDDTGYSCAGEASTLRPLAEIAPGDPIALPGLAAGEVREYRARAVLPYDAGNDLQGRHGTVSLHFTSVLDDGGRDIPDTGADPLVGVALAALAALAGAVVRRLASRPARRASPPPGRG